MPFDLYNALLVSMAVTFTVAASAMAVYFVMECIEKAGALKAEKLEKLAVYNAFKDGRLKWDDDDV